jgi:ribosomal protein L37E
MSMIENLATIKKIGIEEFVKEENKRWSCRQCGELLCVHKPECSCCGHIWNQNQKKKAMPNQEDVPDPKPVR